jgi:hypothetical protein
MPKVRRQYEKAVISQSVSTAQRKQTSNSTRVMNNKQQETGGDEPAEEKRYFGSL